MKELFLRQPARVTVRVIHTDEEWMIAHTVCRVLGLRSLNKVKNMIMKHAVETRS